MRMTDTPTPSDAFEVERLLRLTGDLVVVDRLQPVDDEAYLASPPLETDFWPVALDPFARPHSAT